MILGHAAVVGARNFFHSIKNLKNMLLSMFITITNRAFVSSLDSREFTKLGRQRQPERRLIFFKGKFSFRALLLMYQPKGQNEASDSESSEMPEINHLTV